MPFPTWGFGAGTDGLLAGAAAGSGLPGPTGDTSSGTAGKVVDPAWIATEKGQTWLNSPAGIRYTSANEPPPATTGTAPPVTASSGPNLQDLYTPAFTGGQAAGAQVGPPTSGGAPAVANSNTSVSSPGASSGGVINSGGVVNTDPGANTQITGDIPYEGYTADERELTDEALASKILAEMLAQDSPLMQRSKQEGILMAARRGLQNSSIAAGTAMGAMVDRATPIALQQAQSVTSMQMANAAEANRALIFGAAAANTASLTGAQLQSQEGLVGAQLTSNEALASAQIASNEAMTTAQLSTQASIASAQIAAANAQMSAQLSSQQALANAQMQQQMKMFDAEWANQASMLNAQLAQQTSQFNVSQQNAINMQIMSMNSALNQQYLQGTQTLDLATLQAQNAYLLQNNAMAGEFWNSQINAAGMLMSNPNVSPGQIAANLKVLQNLTDSGLNFLNGMGTINLSSFGGTSQSVGYTPPASTSAPAKTVDPTWLASGAGQTWSQSPAGLRYAAGL